MNSKLDLHLRQIYLDEYLKIAVDDKLRFILVEWLRHVTGEKFREHFRKAANFATALKSEYWLSDARAIHYLEFADQNWLIREMAPLLQKTKLVKFARLTTIESLSLLDATQVYGKLEKLTHLKIKTALELFTDKDVALDWLFSDVDIIKYPNTKIKDSS